MIKRLLASAGLRQSFLLIVGNFLASALSAVGLILLSRQLAPTLFGEFTVGYSLMIIIVRIQGLGVNVAMQKIAGRYFREENWQAKLTKLLQVSTTFNFVAMLLSLFIGFVVSSWLMKLLHIESQEIIWGSFFFAAVTLFFEYLISVLQIIHRFLESVVMMIIQSLLKFLVGGVVLLTGLQNVTTSYYLFYVTPVIGILYGLLALPENVKIFPLRRDAELEGKLITVMKHTAILMATAGLIDYMDVLFVKHYMSPFDTGVYGGISQLASAVMVVGYSLSSVLNARVARYHDFIHLREYLKKAFGIATLGILGFLIYLPLTQLSVAITIGPSYFAGIPYLPGLMFAAFLVIVTAPFIALFYAFDEPAYFSISGIGQLLIVLLGGWVLIPKFGLQGAVWTKIAARIFLFVLTVGWGAIAYRKKILAE